MKVSAGFTLVELIAVISIAAILMAIGVPSFRYVTSSNRMSSEINGLLGDMQLARSEAVKQGRSVTVCSTTDHATCSNSADWSNGWIVFSDPTNLGTVDTGEAILRTQLPLQGGDTLKDLGGTFSRATFNRAGLLSITGMTATGFTLTLRDARSTTGITRCLWIASQGLVMTQTHASVAACQ